MLSVTNTMGYLFMFYINLLHINKVCLILYHKIKNNVYFRKASTMNIKKEPHNSDSNFYKLIYLLIIQNAFGNITFNLY